MRQSVLPVKPPECEKSLTVAETASHAGISVSLVYRLCAERKLAHRRIGCGRGTIRILESDLEEFIQSCRVDQFSLDEDELEELDDLDEESLDEEDESH